MRPILLNMTAFGPYSGSETIDFNELEGRNLFLINGPTGAGKTTIFDAISFAMYGVANGSLRDADTLRSQFAPQDLMTEVELTFDLKGIRYRIKRIPNQMKPKARGEGLTKQTAEAELYIEGETKPIVGHTAVTKHIEDLMGISAEQFRQIMMIPQGEFRKLLTSDSKEREKVLRKLFDTSMYNAVQMKLDDQAKLLSRVIKDDQALRDHELRKIETVDENLLNLLSAEDMNVLVILDKLDSQIECDLKEHDDLIKAVQSQRRLVEAVVKEKEQAENSNKRVNQLEGYRIENKKMVERADVFNVKRHAQNLAERANAIVPYEENFLQLNQQYEKKGSELKELSTRLSRNEEALKVKKKVFDEMMSKETSERLDEYFSKVEKLKGYTGKVTEIYGLSEDIRVLSDSHKKGQDEKLESEKALTEMKDELKDLKESLEKSKEAKISVLENTSKKKSLDDRMDNINQAVDKKKRVIKGEQYIIQVEKKCHEQRLVVEEAQGLLKTAKVKFHLNQAAILASDLEDGMPCPVCGSINHPQVASFEEVLEDDLEVLEQSLKDKEEVYSKNNSDLVVNRERLNDLKNELNEILTKLLIDEEDLLAEKTKVECLQYNLEKEISRLNGLANKEVQLQKGLLDLEKAKDVLEEKMKVLDDMIQTVSTDLKVKEAKFNDICLEVPEQYRKLDDLNKAIKDVSDKREELLNRRSDAQKGYEDLSSQYAQMKGEMASLEGILEKDKSLLDEERTLLQNRISDAGFADSKAYRKARLSKNEMEDLKSEIKLYDQKCHTLKQQIAELEKELKGVQAIDLDVFDKRYEEKKSLLDEYLKNRAGIDKRMSTNKAIKESVVMISGRMGEKEEAYRVIGNLSKVAKGVNKQNITFERYVLAAFLEDILIAANTRLNKMTQGRYVLSRTEELQRKNAQSGLELEVFDHYTGMSRHVKTLSGGEGFKASLAMALGLSDVVQSYSGGVQLDTMFIDEGFGTLDQESLDYAISCLIDLQEAGRLVGIISHVQELKERMDARLEVETSQKGSTTKFVIQ